MGSKSVNGFKSRPCRHCAAAAQATTADVLLLLRELLALHLFPDPSVLSNEQGDVLLLLSDARPSDLEPEIRSCGCCASHRCAQYLPGRRHHSNVHGYRRPIDRAPRWHSCTSDKMGSIDCEWVYPRAHGMPKFEDSPRVILYLHGGAFCLCKPGSHRTILYELAKRTKCTAVAPQYRRPPEHPHPAPLDDCLAAYKWLLERMDATNIIIAGDSAGGALTVMLMAGLTDQNLPMPAGGMLYSPWCDLADTNDSQSWVENAEIDYLPADLARMFASMYCGASDPEAISPTSLKLEGLPPMLMEYGRCEVLYDQQLLFSQKLEAAGVAVNATAVDGMVHAFNMFIFCEMEQTEQSLQRTTDFVKRVLPLQGYGADSERSPLAACGEEEEVVVQIYN